MVVGGKEKGSNGGQAKNMNGGELLFGIKTFSSNLVYLISISFCGLSAKEGMKGVEELALHRFRYGTVEWKRPWALVDYACHQRRGESPMW